MSWLDDERITGPLDSAALMFLAVNGPRGPRVTPLAFDRRGRDLWALTPRDSAKARALRRDPRVGILVRHHGRTVVAGGTAHLVDPLTGRGLGSLLRPGLPLTALGYLGRNDRRAVDAVREHPTPLLPLTRTAIRISLSRGALLEKQRLVAAWGDWPEPSVLLSGDLPTTAPDLTGVPTALLPLLTTDDAAAVLGWHTASGPVALPAAWSAGGAIAVPTGALALTGALSAGPACLTVQASGSRISSVRGLILTGTGRAREDGSRSVVSIDAERVTWWSGEDSGTVTRPECATT